MNLKSLFGLGSKKKIEKSKGTNENLDGIIGEYYENDFPVIVKFVNRTPNSKTQTKLPMLTVISWKYDGSERNGMPTQEVNQRMIKLEQAIANSNSDNKLFEHVYSRTGNNLKELVYYSSTQKDFIQKLNKTLSNHERYPIEIDFYDDREWNEFKKLLNDFNTNEKDKRPNA
ncbi:MAG: DUF695 domain-containing protein [Saprospiraceae bacterium]|nr:DUF695 domain-containing protein [Saprospiraceae bacterium]